MKKLLIVTILISAFLITPTVFAFRTSEFDAAFCDATVFPLTPTKSLVVENNRDPVGGRDLAFNMYSSFPEEDFTYIGEGGELSPDPCFGEEYQSILTPPFTSARYEWTIVLQYIPQTDLNLKIANCVMKEDGEDIYEDSRQTGYLREAPGDWRWEASRNPRITVTASSVRYPDFILEARNLPGLEPTLLNRVLYTAKGLWEEGIVIKRPYYSREDEFELLQGDKIKVAIEVPVKNPHRIRYGPGNVWVEYIGVTGSETWGERCARRIKLKFPIKKIKADVPAD